MEIDDKKEEDTNEVEEIKDVDKSKDDAGTPAKSPKGKKGKKKESSPPFLQTHGLTFKELEQGEPLLIKLSGFPDWPGRVRIYFLYLDFYRKISSSDIFRISLIDPILTLFRLQRKLKLLHMY